MADEAPPAAEAGAGIEVNADGNVNGNWEEVSHVRFGIGSEGSYWGAAWGLDSVATAEPKATAAAEPKAAEEAATEAATAAAAEATEAAAAAEASPKPRQGNAKWRHLYGGTCIKALAWRHLYGGTCMEALAAELANDM